MLTPNISVNISFYYIIFDVTYSDIEYPFYIRKKQDIEII